MAATTSFKLPELLAEKYELLERLGAGQFGTVFKLRNRSSLKLYAIKHMSYGPETTVDRNHIAREVALMATLNHDNVVKTKESVEDLPSRATWMTCELCDNDLGSFIADLTLRGEHLSEAKVLDILYDICKGVSYLHRESSSGLQVIHRDLKPDNLMIKKGPDGSMIVKVGDLGLAVEVEFGHRASGRCGTPLYMSPEQGRGDQYTTSTDLWAIGLIAYELCMLQSPFTALQARNNYAAKPTPPVLTRAYYSSRLDRTILNLLDYNPRRRYSAVEMLRRIDEMRSDLREQTEKRNVRLDGRKRKAPADVPERKHKKGKKAK